MTFNEWYYELFENGNGVRLNQQEIAQAAWDFQQEKSRKLSNEKFHAELVCDAAIERLKQLEVENEQLKEDLSKALGGFTSVGDSLPEEGSVVIVFNKIKHCQFVGGEFVEVVVEHGTGYEYNEPVDVTHWKGVEQ